jgi:Family of unknown function (DUF6588)
MRKLITIAVFISGFIGANQAFAQDEIDKLLKESLDDGKKMVTEYVSPFMKALSLGLNQGWYNTAKPHKLGGFDLTITVSPMYIPVSDETFDASKLNLQQVTVVDPATGLQASDQRVPTLFGTDKTATFSSKSTLGVTADDFEGPPGLNLKKEIGKNFLPVPMAGVGIGLPKGTELKIRFIPKVKRGDIGQLNMFGIGIMHDVKQYIPGIKNLPFDLSGFVGYTHFKLEADLSSTAQNGKGIFEMKSTTIQALISKKVAVLTFYGGFGVNLAKSTLAMKGNYDLDDDGTYETKDPLNASFKASGPRATFGLRLKLAVIAFQADYTLQKYKSLSVGFGINVR